jgi:hypothetical protein
MINDAEVSPDGKYLLIGGATNYFRLMTHCDINTEIFEPDYTCTKCAPIENFELNKDKCGSLLDSRIFVNFKISQNDRSSRELITLTLRVTFEQELAQLEEFKDFNFNDVTLTNNLQFFTI